MCCDGCTVRTKGKKPRQRSTNKVQREGKKEKNPAGVMDVCVVCVLYSKDKKAKPGQSGQRRTDKVHRENKKKIVVKFEVQQP